MWTLFLILIFLISILYFHTIIKHINFQQMHCFRFANAINHTTTINTFNSDNSNITKINIQHHQVMTTIKNRILKFKPIIKIPIAGNYYFWLHQLNSICLNQFYHNKKLTRPIYQKRHQSQKDCHQDDLSSAYNVISRMAWMYLQVIVVPIAK